MDCLQHSPDLISGVCGYLCYVKKTRRISNNSKQHQAAVASTIVSSDVYCIAAARWHNIHQ